MSRQTIKDNSYTAPDLPPPLKVQLLKVPFFTIAGIELLEYFKYQRQTWE